jgi:hypothetical protein
MANFSLVWLVLFWGFTSYGFGKEDILFSETYLGEKKFDIYAERYDPVLEHQFYQGKLYFKDDVFFKNFFQNYSFSQENEFTQFLKSELPSASTCSHELLNEHFETIRYAYRLITLSYLMEAQWHMQLLSRQFKFGDICGQDLEIWAQSCQPKSKDMKKFLAQFIKFQPKYDVTLPSNYKKETWWKDYSSSINPSYSQYQFKFLCQGKCAETDIPQYFKTICQDNLRLMDQICSENDHLYGVSLYRDAYSLIGQSNIINTFNKKGEAMGCMRRFSETLSYKEVKYPALRALFPALQNFLKERYQERFLQGRAFLFGSGKEFEEKGLNNLFVESQKFEVSTIKDEEPVVAITAKTEVKKTELKKVEIVKVSEPVKKKEIQEIREVAKSAFLQAAELRLVQNMNAVEVDMLKLKYDYVFTLNMMTSLSQRLKTFMTRGALKEMVNYDKLGSREGPVPLLFIKFMIDMQEHQGLWNLLSVLGDKFYVSNELDSSFNPLPEYIQLQNNPLVDGGWQLTILAP